MRHHDQRDGTLPLGNLPLMIFIDFVAGEEDWLSGGAVKTQNCFPRKQKFRMLLCPESNPLP